ncbi:hypothetical protein KPH14_010970 [Odynerus spinipes]|uniref:Ankyrin-2-like n=1 Tax=Odynerus spinipes TaxID=1348599 RepID=A0AAD9VU87_9HYME|nr:hypothetical protein KPH14_010970 [Odynerus spinipes]
MCEDPMLSDQQQYRYMTVDDMKSMGDDSMRVNVTDDERDNRHAGAPTITEMITKENYQRYNAANLKPDNIDINRHPVHVGIPQWRNFLVSFLVDARGGAMRGCRHSGVRVIVPPRKAAMPMRVTCRYLRRDKLTNPPPLMEGEALASRILELGPVGAKFLGPVIIEVPHFASLRGKEREIVILRSDNGETWREHTLEASEEAVQDVLNESFEGEELSQLEDLQTSRIVRILTADFPHYFAVVSRIRQEVHAVGPEGGTVSSSAVPQVQAVFPPAALTKKIRVGLQAHPIPAELVAKLLGNRVAVSPIVTVEPRRRKFHKPITLTIPVPQAANKGMINQYSGDAPTLRLLCSITGGQSRAVWEDVTGSTPLTFVKDCVSFTTTVSARFWLMDCRNISEATKMATELYTHATHVPFMAKFVVFAKRIDPLEARIRVFCMTDDKEDKTLEHQEHFTEVAKSRDVEVLEGKTQYMEFTGNLVPVLKSGEQLQLPFRAFKENRVPFTARVKDPDAADMMGRIMFMSEPKVPKGEVPQTPICTLNILLPEKISPEPAVSELDLLELSKNYSFLRDGGISRPDAIHRATIRLRDISNLLGKDWEQLAEELNIAPNDVSLIKQEYPDKPAQQAAAMFKLWQSNGNKATGNTLEKALQKIGREDIVNKCIFNVELVTDDVEKAVARVRLDQPGFDSLKEELGPSRDTSLRRDATMDPKMDPDYEEPDRMKESESVEDLSGTGRVQDKRPKQHVTIANGTVFNGTSTPIKDKYASDEKEFGDMMADFLEHKCHVTDTMSKKSCDEPEDEDKKRQRVIADANKIVSGVIAEAEKEKEKLAKEGWSVVYDDMRDSEKVRGAVGQDLFKDELAKSAEKFRDAELGIIVEPKVVDDVEPLIIKQERARGGKGEPKKQIPSTKQVTTIEKVSVVEPIVRQTTIIKEIKPTADTTTSKDSITLPHGTVQVVSEKEKMSKEGKEVDEKLAQDNVKEGVKTSQITKDSDGKIKTTETKPSIGTDIPSKNKAEQDEKSTSDKRISAYKDVYDAQHTSKNSDEETTDTSKKSKDKSTGIFSGIFKTPKLKKGKSKDSKETSFDSGDEESKMLPISSSNKDSEIAFSDMKLATLNLLEDAKNTAAILHVPSESSEKNGSLKILVEDKKNNLTDDVHSQPQKTASAEVKKERTNGTATIKPKQVGEHLESIRKSIDGDDYRNLETTSRSSPTKQENIKKSDIKETTKSTSDKDDTDTGGKDRGGLFGIFKSPKSKDKKSSKSKESSFDYSDEELKSTTEKFLEETRKIANEDIKHVGPKTDDMKSLATSKVHTFSAPAYDTSDVPVDKVSGHSYDIVGKIKHDKNIIKEPISEKQDSAKDIADLSSKQKEPILLVDKKSDKEITEEGKEKGNFFGIFKSPKLKTKKRTKSRDRGTSKERSFDSADEDSYNADVKHVERSNVSTIPKEEEGQESGSGDEGSKSSGIFGMFKSPRLQRGTRSKSKEKSLPPEAPSAELKETTAKFLEDTRNTADVISGYQQNEKASLAQKITDKIDTTADAVVNGMKDTKDAASKGIKEDVHAVKSAISNGASTVADEAQSAKEKVAKEAKKAKEKGSGFFSGIFKGAKHAVDDVTDDAKEFVEDTKVKAAKEEARAKETAAQTAKTAEDVKDKAADNVKDFKDKTAAAVQDVTHKTSAAAKEASEKTVAGAELVKEKIVTSTKDTTDKLIADAQDIKEKAAAGVQDAKDKTIVTTKDIKEKAETKISEMAQKTTETGDKVVQGAKDAKAAVAKEVEKDVKSVKDAISSGATAAADETQAAKEKTAKEAKKAKEKGSGFFSGLFKGAKHAVEDVTDDVKEFLDETKAEAAEEEARAKEAAERTGKAVHDAKDKAASGIKELKDKTVSGVEDVKEKTGAAVKDAKEKTAAGAGEVKEKIVAGAKGAKDKVVAGTQDIAEKVAAGVHDTKEKTVAAADDVKTKLDTKMSEDTKEKTVAAADDVKTKLDTEMSEVAQKTADAGENVVKGAQDAKFAVAKEVEKDAQTVKGAISSGASTVADEAQAAKDKAAKEAKKAKEKGSGFLSGLFKGAKHAVEDVTDDVKEFLDETKAEASEEEARAKDAADRADKAVHDAKYKAIGDVKKLNDKTASGIKDAEKKTNAAFKDVKEKATTAADEIKEKIITGAKDARENVIAGGHDIKEKTSAEMKDAKDKSAAVLENIKTEADSAISGVARKCTETTEKVVTSTKDAKDAVSKELQKDTQSVKGAISSGAAAVADGALTARDKASTEATKAKEKGSGFFSGIFKGSKTSAEDITNDVKEFLEVTKAEAAEEEARAKEAAIRAAKTVDDAKDKALSGVVEVKGNAVTGVHDVKQKVGEIVTDATDKASTDAKVVSEKVVTGVKNAKDKLVSEAQNVKEKAVDNVKDIKDKATAAVDDTRIKAESKITDAKHKTVLAGENIVEGAKDAKAAVAKEVEKDVKSVKDAISSGASAAADEAQAAKEKTAKEAKKAKEKGSGFLSGLFKGAKHAVEDVTDDVKEFLDETKAEAAEEEVRAKEAAERTGKAVHDAKDKAASSIKELKNKTVSGVEDAKDKTSAAVKDAKDKTAAGAHEVQKMLRPLLLRK